jgi:5-formyltetrahydrofolate cyclo-ligase
MKTKDEIRLEMREKRKKITQEERREASKAITKNLVEGDVRLFLWAWRICMYLSTPHEIPTRYIARATWEAGRELCVPYWSVSQEEYKLSLMEPSTKLVTGKMGIREPQVRIPVQPFDVDVFIIPGLAFDMRGGRLGYGAGIYDDLLSQARKISQKIAVCYDWQVLEEPLPLEPHDICVDWIVTDKRVISCKAND